MPQEMKPIDDNTLFILLALRQNNQIVIPNVKAVYDYDVNYDNTAILEGKEYPQDINKIASAGIDYIVDNFGVAKNEQEDGTIILHFQNVHRIADFLNEYLQGFPRDTRYYYDETKHRKRLYEFITSEHFEVSRFEGKYFTYKLLPENNKEKYKMIEYIARLIEQGLMIAGSDTFYFDHESGMPKKVIYLRFTDSLKAEELFIDELNADEQERVKKELLNTKPILESEKWLLYDEKAEYNIMYKPSKKSGHISPRFHKVIRFALEHGNGEVITPQNYIKHSKNKELNSEQAIKTYFADAEKQIAKVLNIQRPTIFHSLGDKRWQIIV